jgi:hypothetical protein
MTKELDITTEQSRTYTYANGATFTIEAPTTLYIIEDERGTSHRVVDANGATHRPERGWVGISWTAKEGAPKFVA